MSAPTDDEVAAEWQKLGWLIERMLERVANRDEFPVAARSSLARDDADTAPYQASHAVRLCITAGVDHLHAIKQLVIDDRVLHMAAPQALARAALETFSAAYWIIQPSKRSDRIERTLRWYAQNFRDQDRATKALGGAESGIENSTLDEKLEKLQHVADGRDIGDGFRSGYRSSDAVKWAEEHGSGRALFPWQLCSGFAHGRPWAYLGALDREQFETEEVDVVHLRMTNSETTALFPVQVAVRLLDDLLKIYSRRAAVYLT